MAMPGTPAECNIHASHCLQLAEKSTAPDIRAHFMYLAQQWMKLARDLEDTHKMVELIGSINYLEDQEVQEYQEDHKSNGG